MKHIKTNMIHLMWQDPSMQVAKAVVPMHSWVEPKMQSVIVLYQFIKSLRMVTDLTCFYTIVEKLRNWIKQHRVIHYVTQFFSESKSMTLFHLGVQTMHVLPHTTQNRKYRQAQTYCAPAHNMEIDRGRHTRPVTPVDVFVPCVTLKEDEEHLHSHCVKYAEERNFLFSKIVIPFPDFQHLNANDKLVFLISFQDSYIPKLVGKYVYSCFQ